MQPLVEFSLDFAYILKFCTNWASSIENVRKCEKVFLHFLKIKLFINYEMFKSGTKDMKTSTILIQRRIGLFGLPGKDSTSVQATSNYIRCYVSWDSFNESQKNYPISKSVQCLQAIHWNTGKYTLLIGFLVRFEPIIKEVVLARTDAKCTVKNIKGGVLVNFRERSVKEIKQIFWSLCGLYYVKINFFLEFSAMQLLKMFRKGSPLPPMDIYDELYTR